MIMNLRVYMPSLSYKIATNMKNIAKELMLLTTSFLLCIGCDKPKEETDSGLSSICKINYVGPQSNVPGAFYYDAQKRLVRVDWDIITMAFPPHIDTNYYFQTFDYAANAITVKYYTRNYKSTTDSEMVSMRDTYPLDGQGRMTAPNELADKIQYNSEGMMDYLLKGNDSTHFKYSNGNLVKETEYQDKVLQYTITYEYDENRLDLYRLNYVQTHAIGDVRMLDHYFGRSDKNLVKKLSYQQEGSSVITYNYTYQFNDRGFPVARYRSRNGSTDTVRFSDEHCQ